MIVMAVRRHDEVRDPPTRVERVLEECSDIPDFRFGMATFHQRAFESRIGNFSPTPRIAEDDDFVFDLFIFVIVSNPGSCSARLTIGVPSVFRQRPRPSLCNTTDLRVDMRKLAVPVMLSDEIAVCI